MGDFYEYLGKVIEGVCQKINNIRETDKLGADLKMIKQQCFEIIVYINKLNKLEDLLSLLEGEFKKMIAMLRDNFLLSEEIEHLFNTLSCKINGILFENFFSESEPLIHKLEYLETVMKVISNEVFLNQELYTQFYFVINSLRKCELNCLLESVSLRKIISEFSEGNYKEAYSLVQELIIKKKKYALIFKCKNKGNADISEEEIQLTERVIKSIDGTTQEELKICISAKNTQTQEKSFVKKTYISRNKEYLEIGYLELRILQRIKESHQEGGFVKLYGHETSLIGGYHQLAIFIEKLNYNLSDLIKDIALYSDEKEIKQMILDISHQLNVLHSLGVIYNDIKPNNIMLGYHGARIIDFNISLTIDSDEPSVVNFKKIPSKYLSPELHLVLKHKLFHLKIDLKKSEIFIFSLLILELFQNFTLIRAKSFSRFYKDLENLVNLQDFYGFHSLFEVINFQNRVQECISESFIYPWAKELLIGCLNFNPDLRPSFTDILNILSTK